MRKQGVYELCVNFADQLDWGAGGCAEWWVGLIDRECMGCGCSCMGMDVAPQQMAVGNCFHTGPEAHTLLSLSSPTF